MLLFFYWSRVRGNSDDGDGVEDDDEDWDYDDDDDEKIYKKKMPRWIDLIMDNVM